MNNKGTKKGLRVTQGEMKMILASAAIILVMLIVKCCTGGGKEDEPIVVEEPKVDLLYGYDRSKYEVHEGVVQQGQVLSSVLDGLISQSRVNRLAEATKDVYDLARNIRPDKKWALFMSVDSLGTRTPAHFVYEINRLEVLHADFMGDKISARIDKKQLTYVRRKVSAAIESSLWNALVSNDIPGALAVEIENIYGWSVDFFHLHEGDTFTIIYDESYAEGERVGIGMVFGAYFKHAGRDYYAIPFEQNGKLDYWDEKGGSMRRQFLKAPLKYSRISSGFSNSRLHPIKKIYRPHHGVDYAAPVGTPVVAIADGTVSKIAYEKGGAGKYMKITHSNGYVSTYMHLNGYAKGIKVGSRVKQGETICYVGNTGGSTGPHLDFRIHKNGSPINPLKIPSTSVEPVKKENMAAFEVIRDKVLAELMGDGTHILKGDINPNATEIVYEDSRLINWNKDIRRNSMFDALDKI